MTIPATRPPSRASLGDTLAILRDVVLPTLAAGPLIRRRGMVGYAERARMTERAVERLQRIRQRYGDRPLLLPIPFRRQLVVLAPEDVKRILEGAPEPFAPASLEKRSALNHFEPQVALASHGAARERRRALNEAVLETPRPVHSLAEGVRRIVEEEMAVVGAKAAAEGQLDWEMFFPGWYRLVRRIVLGDAAREDTALTDLLAQLRRRANYAFLVPKAPRRRQRLHEMIAAYLDRAESGSLAHRIAQLPPDPQAAPTHQVAQWLFAFDPGGMALFRTLALLAVHPAIRADIEAEAEAGNAYERPLARAAYLEALRLWPTTPAILRETTTEVRWPDLVLPDNLGILIYVPFFHRDDEKIVFAHLFAPDNWLSARGRDDWPLVPFSAGPAICPAVNFVPLVATLALAGLLKAGPFALAEPHRLDPDKLPGTLDPYSLVFVRESRPAQVT